MGGEGLINLYQGLPGLRLALRGARRLWVDTGAHGWLRIVTAGIPEKYSYMLRSGEGFRR